MCSSDLRGIDNGIDFLFRNIGPDKFNPAMVQIEVHDLQTKGRQLRGGLLRTSVYSIIPPILRRERISQTAQWKSDAVCRFLTPIPAAQNPWFFPSQRPGIFDIRPRGKDAYTAIR